jgi:hypothetical protein
MARLQMNPPRHRRRGTLQDSTPLSDNLVTRARLLLEESETLGRARSFLCLWVFVEMAWAKFGFRSALHISLGRERLACDFGSFSRDSTSWFGFFATRWYCGPRSMFCPNDGCWLLVASLDCTVSWYYLINC